MFKTIVFVISIFAIGAMLITATTAAYACMAKSIKEQQQLQQKTVSPSSSSISLSGTMMSNASTPKLTKPTSTGVQTQKKIQERSLPTSIILADLRMPAKNTTDYGIVDLTVTLKNATKIRSFNTTSFSSDNIVMPFRFNPKNDNINIQVGDKFTLCASGEFLASAVCQTDTIKTKSPPITRTNIELG
jgi:hypothetical protein